jgi:hypothetical protein
MLSISSLKAIFTLTRTLSHQRLSHNSVYATIQTLSFLGIQDDQGTGWRLREL